MPIKLNDVVLQVSASIGVAVYPESGEDVDQLLRNADKAMYIAKQEGKNRYHLFDHAQDAVAKERRETLDSIETALKRHEFKLYYQPKVNMTTGQMVGAEALIRWQHPERGLLEPNAFLPVIEGHQISTELGDWVIKTAIAQIDKWRKEGHDIPVSVNINAQQLQKENFVSCLNTLFSHHPGVDPCFLELEMLETSALENIEWVSEIMHKCRSIGVSFALDDFGTGYSSLTYLQRLPIKQLKIDRTFVAEMLDKADALAIVKGIVGLAKSFNIGVVAEGVETISHGSKLLPLGCNIAQGFGIALPMPGAELPDWADTWCPSLMWIAQRENVF
jgi:EAL domain-containing protein (putative c-di-GMP-specific phosphodiesterase class I)